MGREEKDGGKIPVVSGMFGCSWWVPEVYWRWGQLAVTEITEQDTYICFISFKNRITQY